MSRQLSLAFDGPRCRLRQSELRKQPTEPAFALRSLVARKARQRQADKSREPILDFGKQKSLLVDRQEHVEVLTRDQVENEGEISFRIDTQSRAAMKAAHQPRKPAQAMPIRIADIDLVTGQRQTGDRLSRRGTRPLGKKDA